MSSWMQLLLALLAACLFGVTEGDPLPAALVELVRNSPISSIEDLQLLLLSDSVDEEDRTSAANGGQRLPRSLDAQPAQQALCKVRTEVVEVTRAMLDRSNANFLLWPPCVEVQRCSGCCNTKSLQCVPVVTHTRYLQVMKIEYINKRPTYAKAVVSVVDHVECRCQQAPRTPVPKKKSRRPHNHQHRNQTLSQGHGQVKSHSKDELHQWDELKQNQRVHLEDLLDQHWSPRGDTFTQSAGGYSLAGEDTSHTGEAILFAPHWAHNASRLLEAKDQTQNLENVERNRTISHGNRTVSSVENVDAEVKTKLVEGEEGLLLNSTEGKVNEGKGSRDEGMQTYSPLWQEDKSKPSRSYTSGSSHSATQVPPAKFSPTEAPSERAVSRFRPTKEPNPEPQEAARRRDNETPEEARILQIEEEKLEQERKELLLLHKRLDLEKEILRQQMRREEEERQKEKEMQHHLHGKHHHHLQTTTHKPATTSTTTHQPSAPSGPRPPARPKKRMRKNRKRISKAAMRAMLM